MGVRAQKRRPLLVQKEQRDVLNASKHIVYLYQHGLALGDGEPLGLERTG
jgi:hypothetical protein